MTAPNRLADETSPYLRQHADNPVDWFPWGEEAWADRPASETSRCWSRSATRPATGATSWPTSRSRTSEVGALVNQLFVSIKVDREERPDVDAVYMDAVQAMTGSGGWPMTVFCLPDGRPFFAGTYFPKETRGEHDRLRRAVPADRRAVADPPRRPRGAGREGHRGHRQRRAAGPRRPHPPAPRCSRLRSAALLAQADRHDGGFGRAPKFPQTMSIDTLLRHHRRTGDPDGPRRRPDARSTPWRRAGSTTTSVAGSPATRPTARWLVPHFEKMLYDQALLARVYLHAWQLTGEPKYRQVLDETIGYVLRELRHPLGGFFSAEDADSEGVEGKFYVWSLEEVRAVAGADADAAIEWYGVTAGGQLGGHQHPRAARSGATSGVRPRSSGPEPPSSPLGRSGCAPGSTTRSSPSGTRLMLATLAEAAAATGDAAVDRGGDRQRRVPVRRAASGRRPLAAHVAGPGRRRPVEAGRAKILAYAADHAALVDAFVRMAELTGEARWLAEALSTAASLLELFWDDEAGGVFTTGYRCRSARDPTQGADGQRGPVGQQHRRLSVSCAWRRSRVTSRCANRRRSSCASSARPPVGFPWRSATSCTPPSCSSSAPPRSSSPATGPTCWPRSAATGSPLGVIAWGERTGSPLWEGRDETGPDGRAYVCRGYVCGLPATDVDTLTAQLRARTRSAHPTGTLPRAVPTSRGKGHWWCRGHQLAAVDDLVERPARPRPTTHSDAASAAA